MPKAMPAMPDTKSPRTTAEIGKAKTQPMEKKVERTK
jgi:hypothetical protein